MSTGLKLVDTRRLDEDVDFRRQVAEQLGTGFVIPAYEERLMRPMRSRIKQERGITVRV